MCEKGSQVGCEGWDEERSDLRAVADELGHEELPDVSGSLRTR